VPYRLPALALCCLFCTVAPRTAAAEWHFTPMVGATFFGSTNLIDLELGTDNVHRNFGGSLSLFGGGLLGVEALGVWTPGFFDDDKDPVQLVKSSNSYTLMGNVILTAPRRWTEFSLRPFVSGGVGWMRVSTVEQFDVLNLNQNVLGFNIGGGAVGFFTPRTGVRFDFRYHSNLKPTDEGPALGTNVRIRYLTASVGLVLRRFN
jgi:hypothetical protein